MRYAKTAAMTGIGIRLTGNERDVQAFLRSLADDPQIGEVPASDPVPSRSDERLGHVELVEVIIRIGEGVAARAVYERIKLAFDAFRRRRRMWLEEIVDDEVSD